jgi:hypothetical protein
MRKVATVRSPGAKRLDLFTVDDAGTVLRRVRFLE